VYSYVSAGLLAAFMACPNVAEYSNEKPCSPSDTNRTLTAPDFAASSHPATSVRHR
jgi:hypothetical protein